MVTTNRQMTLDELVDIKHEAIDRVEANADEIWLETAYRVAVAIAKKQRLFSADDVWMALAFTDQVTHEKRAMGAVMRRIDREGIAKPTKDYVASVRPQRHAGPIRVWASCLHWPRN